VQNPWSEAFIERLADYVPSDDLRRRALRVVLDDLAAMISTARTARGLPMRDAQTGDRGEATIVGGARSTRARAAQRNATLACSQELDGGYRRAGCHGALYTLPAVFAEAEAEGRLLTEVVDALVVGYEIVTGVARHVRPELAAALHPHALLSPLGAAAALTWLRTRDVDAALSAAEVGAALGIRGPYPLAFSGDPVRNTWAGAGAILGFVAAEAHATSYPAASGYSSSTPADATDSSGALRGMLASPVAPTQDWAITDAYQKSIAACQYAHAAIEAASEIGAVAAAEVGSVEVRTHAAALRLTDREPRTDIGARFSLPHLVAVVLITGRTDSDALGALFLDDPAVRALRQRITLRPFEPLPPYPHDRPARVEVVDADGNIRSAECLSARGGPDHPLDEGELGKKWASIASPGYAAQARALLADPIDEGRTWRETLDDLIGA
jgi:2-methylcitrate dehydratase PrpD